MGGLAFRREIMKFMFVVIVATNASRTAFELEPLFNNRALPEGLALAPKFVSNIATCASQCHSHPNCSVFGFNKETTYCQLFGDVFSLSRSEDLGFAGERYYAYQTEWCPFRSHYYMFRSLSLCIKIVETKQDYTEAKASCDREEANLIALGNTDKFAAVLNVVELSGLTSSIYVGADDMELEGVFVWSDGRNVTSEFWLPNNPSNSGGNENCAVISYNGLNDLTCSWKLWFICEKH